MSATPDPAAAGDADPITYCLDTLGFMLDDPTHYPHVQTARSKLAAARASLSALRAERDQALFDLKGTVSCWSETQLERDLFKAERDTLRAARPSEDEARYLISQLACGTCERVESALYKGVEAEPCEKDAPRERWCDSCRARAYLSAERKGKS